MSEKVHAKPILVGGIGNILMGDDGVGVHVVRKLEPAYNGAGDIEVCDLGTPGLSLLHTIAGRRTVILVDCADFAGEPGTYRCFSPGELRSIKKMSGFSLHEGDLLQIIQLSRNLGECPDRILLVGIQPAYIGATECLSSRVSSKLNDYVKAVENLVQT